MKREIIVTNDDSHTVAIPELNVTYHSKHGAIRESLHVFIDAGLRHFTNLHQQEVVSIFEVGFGTGLNALLAMHYAIEHQQKIDYYAIELFPLTKEEYELLNHGKEVDLQNEFLKIHESEWEKEVVLNDYFTLHKTQQSLVSFSSNRQFDLIFFDAFAPNDQPELWTKEVFEKMNSLLNKNGLLTTYCSKGDVRRAMLDAGFSVSKQPGPPFKTHMLRAIKLVVG